MKPELEPYLDKAKYLIDHGYARDILGPYAEIYKLAVLMYNADKKAGRISANTHAVVVTPPPS